MFNKSTKAWRYSEGEVDEGLLWRGNAASQESYIGLLYIMGTHLERIKLTRGDKWKPPAPILGLQNMTVCVYTCSIYEDGMCSLYIIYFPNNAKHFCHFEITKYGST